MSTDRLQYFASTALRQRDVVHVPTAIATATNIADVKAQPSLVLGVGSQLAEHRQLEGQLGALWSEDLVRLEAQAKALELPRITLQDATGHSRWPPTNSLMRAEFVAVTICRNAKEKVS